MRELPLRRLGSKTDAVELLSAAGTFLTAVAAVIAASSIILDEIARSGNAAIVLSGRVAQKQQLIEQLDEDPCPEEPEEIERLLEQPMWPMQNHCSTPALHQLRID